jgi:septum site-determining protein MinC
VTDFAQISEVPFQLKASFSPCAVLQLSTTSMVKLAEGLEKEVNKAPNFFIGCPVILDVTHLSMADTLDIKALKQIVLNHYMVPIGIRGASASLAAEAVTQGIPHIATGRVTQDQVPVFSSTQVTNDHPSAEPVSQSSQIVMEKQTVSQHLPAMIVTTPVRSGQQIYARQKDLIILASVSPGAEIMADGNIHVYGPLRGRALAGVLGDQAARIFCTVLEAELIAIAGFYLVKEEIQQLNAPTSMVQIYLNDEKIIVENLSIK